MLRDWNYSAEIVIWFLRGSGEIVLFWMYKVCNLSLQMYGGWVGEWKLCKHKKHSQNINTKEKLLGTDYYLLSIWIIEKFISKVWIISMNFYNRRKQTAELGLHFFEHSSYLYFSLVAVIILNCLRNEFC